MLTSNELKTLWEYWPTAEDPMNISIARHLEYTPKLLNKNFLSQEEFSHLLAEYRKFLVYCDSFSRMPRC